MHRTAIVSDEHSCELQQGRVGKTTDVDDVTWLRGRGRVLSQALGYLRDYRDTGAALAPGTSKVMTVHLPVGHYALVCNLPGHYAAGMHQDFWVTPAA